VSIMVPYEKGEPPLELARQALPRIYTRSATIERTR
jgi:hypothetical protein